MTSDPDQMQRAVEFADPIIDKATNFGIRRREIIFLSEIELEKIETSEHMISGTPPSSGRSSASAGEIPLPLTPHQAACPAATYIN